jgi:hypothetical protein
VSGYLALFRRPAVRALAFAALAAFVVLPLLFLVGGLSKVPPPVAGLDWVKTNRPDAILYSGSLRRHAEFYWREGKTVAEPKTEADCIEFRKVLESGRPVLSTNSQLCGIDGRSSSRSSAMRAFTTSTTSSRSSPMAKALAPRVETQSANT